MKDGLQRLACGLALLLLSAAPPASTAAPPHSGIVGRTFIYRGPAFPGPIGAFPGPVAPAVVTHFPVVTSFTVLAAQSGRVVAQVTTDGNGDLSLRLHPGRYIIVPADLPDFSFCSFQTPEPFEVTVRAREFSGAGFTYIADCPPGVVGIP